VSAYLSATSLAEAVQRLANSCAKTRICEYLIGLRTLTLSGSQEAQIAASKPHYVTAVNEFTLCSPAGAPIESLAGTPYFNPFGAARASGYKSPKYISNGPSNTIHGWATQFGAPFEVISTSRPKAIRRRAVDSEELAKFLLNPRTKASRPPRLIDAAAWYFRFTDLSELDLGHLQLELEKAFIARVGIDEQAQAGLFETENAQDELEVDQ